MGVQQKRTLTESPPEPSTVPPVAAMYIASDSRTLLTATTAAETKANQPAAVAKIAVHTTAPPSIGPSRLHSAASFASSSLHLRRPLKRPCVVHTHRPLVSMFAARESDGQVHMSQRGTRTTDVQDARS